MQIKHFSYLVVTALLATFGAAVPAAANTDGSLHASSSNLEKRPNFKIAYHGDRKEAIEAREEVNDLEKRPNFKIAYHGDRKEAEGAYPFTVPLLLAWNRGEQTPKSLAMF
ncbi:hypothetical protein BDW66DRAFT_146969 [Aspergillus desertorum]